MPLQVFKSQVENEIAAKFVKKVCALRESQQFGDVKIKESVIIALRDVKGADEKFVEKVLKKLIDKYPEIDFPKSV